jgi:hypothetical protein
MSYIITVEFTLSQDDDNRVSMSRDYKIKDLGGIPEAIEHAGRTLALAAEGVEKFDTENII